MSKAWRASIITLMPEMWPGPLAHSIVGDALEKGLWSLDVLKLREFGIGAHQKVDDTPYGGGAGMVIRPDVADAAMSKAKEQSPEATLVHLSPRGERLTQPLLQELAQKPAIFFCGRYEAVDERALEKHQPREISLGDFVLAGGDIAAMTIIEGIVRLLPGVLGHDDSIHEESFGSGDYSQLLEYPHYTKPAMWDGREIPEILTSGHHANVAKWRHEQAKAVTTARRPDLLAKKTS